MKIYNLKLLSERCPSQWSALDNRGQRVIIEYLWGKFRIRIDHEFVYLKIVGDIYDGHMTEERMLELVEEYDEKNGSS